jgi:hypothetical protein
MPEEFPPITCADCKAIAPETETAYTLIGQQFGWRLKYVVDADGKRVPEWRCDKCFRARKASEQR